jgi:HSP20 family molecular chaperone IbpA
VFHRYSSPFFSASTRSSVLSTRHQGLDGYPPYNIERLARDERDPERSASTSQSQLHPRSARRLGRGKQLVIRGRQVEDKSRAIPSPRHRGRQFQRTFRAGGGMEVLRADLKKRLLSVDLARPDRSAIVRNISITPHD